MESVVKFVCSRTERQLLLLAAIMRIGMICYSVFHDHVFLVRYTDIDYDVVTDGAKAMWAGFPSSSASPFERVTYRYTPLLALVMLPNVFFYAFGKLLLGACDVAAGWYAFDCFARTAGVSSATADHVTWKHPKFLLSLFLLFNPIVVNVSTRGNSDMIVSFLVLATLSNFARQRYWAAGLFLGLSVHVKIYPIVYVPCFVFALLQRTASAKAKKAIASRASGSSRGGSSSSTTSSAPTYVRDPTGTGAVHLAQERAEAALVNSPSFGKMMAAVFEASFLRSVFAAAAGVVVAAGAPTLLCYAWYGQQYLDEALLYHIGRVDHRHNFSPYWYPMYLGMAVRDVPGVRGPGFPAAVTNEWLKTGLLAFVPQFGAMLAAAWVLRRNVAHAVTVVTMIFVCFNKVCTVQYFVWYLPFLPFVFSSGVVNQRASFIADRKGEISPVVKGLITAALWFGALVLWMVESVELELRGRDAFVPLWIVSLLFFGMQVVITRAVALAAVQGQRSDFSL